MDKLKEKLFEITVGVVGVALLALVFLFVIQPLQTLGKKQGEMESQTNSLRSKARKTPIPTPRYVERLTERKKASEAALASAESFYDELGKTYRTYFNGQLERPELNVFVSSYKDAIDKLVADYRGKFNIVLDADQPDQTAPRVSAVEIIQTIEQIDLAMKSYWILQELFAAVTAEEIDGLKLVEFPELMSQEKDPPPYWRIQKVQARLDMKFSKVENLLTRLYASQVVPFLLEELLCQKNSELLTPFVPLDHSEEFDDESAARLSDYDTLVPEPNVSVTLTLRALEWKGIPKETQEVVEE